VEPENNATASGDPARICRRCPTIPTIWRTLLQALAGPGAGPSGGQIYIDGFSGGQLPPKETIREVRINQNPFSAEYDRLGFGRIEILTKPGTGKFHGMLFFNDSDAVFDSRNPFASNKPDYSNRQYGGNVSGPINKKMLLSSWITTSATLPTTPSPTRSFSIPPLCSRAGRHRRRDAADEPHHLAAPRLSDEHQ
jgi:hypothetical protein